MGDNGNFDIDIGFWPPGRSSSFGFQAAEPDTNSELADILSLTYPSQRSAGSLDFEVFQEERRASSPSLTSTRSCAGQSTPCSERDADLAQTSRPRSAPHTPTTRRHRCLKCDETFNTGDALEIHAIALRHASFACSMKDCKKAYSRRDACTRHVSTHMVDARHPCSLCQRDFKRKDHLNRHMRVQHLQDTSKPANNVPTSRPIEPDMKKVMESENVLRQQLSPDNLAIKMLDIAGHSESTEKGAQKAFAVVVACAALHAKEILPDRAKRRLDPIHSPGREIEAPDLEVMDTFDLKDMEACDFDLLDALKPG